MRLLALTLSSLLLTNCGGKPQNSDTTTVDLPHSSVKWQSIGNCWAYSHLAWAESMLLSAGQSYNFSESYHTYRHFEEQLVNNSWIEEVNTGGNFYPSMRLIKKYGLMREGDFISSEADKAISYTQSSAVSYLNRSLKSGKLKDSRDPATVRGELNKAFGLSSDQFEHAIKKVIKPESLVLSTDAEGKDNTLLTQIGGWKEIHWDFDYSNAPQGKDKKPVVASQLSDSRVALLRRVMRAMNAGYPVILNWFVDFNAIDKAGVLSAENLAASGWGRQGYHSVVLEDYTVTGINPETNEAFTIGEGEVSAAEKELAAKHGNITAFIIKNSWGGAERTDRSSYNRLGEFGYHKLNASYLFAWLPTHSETDFSTFNGYETVINSVVLPAGF